jgi:hypothetical protein
MYLRFFLQRLNWPCSNATSKPSRRRPEALFIQNWLNNCILFSTPYIRQVEKYTVKE